VAKPLPGKPFDEFGKVGLGHGIQFPAAVGYRRVNRPPGDSALKFRVEPLSPCGE